MNPFTTLCAALGGLLLSACATPIESYRGSQPAFDLKQFFDGELTASGLFIDYRGKVARRFTVEMRGSWQGDSGKLEEWFVYDDGERQTRVWHLQRSADGRYEGRAEDIEGVALGRSEGFALNWRYAMQLPYQGGTIAVRFDDWMYLMDQQRLINRARVTKWGFQVGEVLLYIEKKPR